MVQVIEYESERRYSSGMAGRMQVMEYEADQELQRHKG